MRRHYRRDIALLAKKQRCPEKINLRVTSPASPKKMIFILDSSQIHPVSAEIPHLFTPRKGSRSTHRRCSTREGVLRDFAKFKGKDLCQSLFFNKATDLGPATLLKKKLWRRCFPVSFAKFLITLFLQNTPRRLLLEFQLFFYGDLYRRFYILVSSEKQET